MDDETHQFPDRPRDITDAPPDELSDEAILGSPIYRNLQTVAQHRQLVATFLLDLIAQLTRRAVAHDLSKFGPVEFPPYTRALPLFERVEYGSDAYRAAIRTIKPAVDHHVTTNRHHPEYFGEAGIGGMNLLDVLEMVCDWTAAANRVPGGTSPTFEAPRLDLQRERFGIDAQLAALIENTVALLIPPEAG